MTAWAAGRRLPWRDVLPPFLAARVLTLAAMAVAVVQTTGGVSLTSLRSAFVHWDAISYLSIAGHGYPTGVDYHDAYLPGYPLLVRSASFLTGDLVLAAVAVSAVAELVALFAIEALVRRERDAGAARLAVWVIAFAPMGIFLAGAYTESVFIAASALALLMARAGNARGASLAAAVAVATRLTGLVLLPVIALELLWRRRRAADLPWLAIIPLPLVLFGGYLWLRSGDPLAFFHAQSLPSFGEALAWPWDGLHATLETAATSADPTNRAIFVRELAGGIAGLAIVVMCWFDRRLPATLALFCTLVWLMAVSLTFWRSEPRYDLALFPAVIVLADVTARARVIRPVVVAAGAVVLVWGAHLFAEGGWVG